VESLKGNFANYHGKMRMTLGGRKGGKGKRRYLSLCTKHTVTWSAKHGSAGVGLQYGVEKNGSVVDNEESKGGRGEAGLPRPKSRVSCVLRLKPAEGEATSACPSPETHLTADSERTKRGEREGGAVHPH